MDTNPTTEGGPEGVTPARMPVPERELPPQTQKIVLQQPGGLFGRFGKYLWIVLMISVMGNFGQRAAYESYFLPTDKIEEKYHSLSKDAETKVAVIRVQGTILEGNGFAKHQIDQVRKDMSVKAVVLRIDSPGGTVTASDYIYHHLKGVLAERQIPMVVSMGSLCASGGYYIAMAAGDQEDCIFAEPTSWTGSIGVIIPHFDVSELLERWNIKDDSIASHPLKQLGSPTRKLSDQERAEHRKILQAMVDDTFARFKDIVRAGRPAFRDDDRAVETVATGQIYTANQALKIGLVDRVGFMEDAIERAVELAGLDKNNVRVVKYTQHLPGVLETLTGTEVRTTFRGHFDLSRLLDLTAPRAYYLCTWMPSLLSNTKP